MRNEPTLEPEETAARRRPSSASSPSRRLLNLVGSLLVLLPLATFAGCSQSLGAVSGIQVTPNGTSLEVTWNPVPGASGYFLYLDTSPGVSTSKYSIFADTSTAQETVKELTIGKTYYCIVVAQSIGGLVLGPSSNVVSVNLSGTSTTNSTSVPIIEAVTAYPGSGGQVLLAATASDSTGASLTYSWSVDGTAVGSQSSQVVWQGTVGSGTHTATVSVSDGTTSVSESLPFTI